MTGSAARDPGLPESFAEKAENRHAAKGPSQAGPSRPVAHPTSIAER